jgi:hypothetical protein
MAKTQDAAAATMTANLKEKTGKSLEQWTAIAATLGPKHGEIVAALKARHGLTHGYANMVAHATLKSDAVSLSATTDLVAAQYAGEKEALRPIYDAIVKAARACGDVEIAPKKGYVSLRRSKQFAIVQPSTKTRVDLGLNLKGIAPTARLEASGGFNAMVSHRVRLESVKDVDAELKKWIKAAFAAA